MRASPLPFSIRTRGHPTARASPARTGSRPRASRSTRRSRRRSNARSNSASGRYGCQMDNAFSSSHAATSSFCTTHAPRRRRASIQFIATRSVRRGSRKTDGKCTSRDVSPMLISGSRSYADTKDTVSEPLNAWHCGSHCHQRFREWAVLLRDFKTDKTFIITRSDVIRVPTQVRGERGAAAR